MTVIVKCKDISKAYDNKVLFNKSSFYIKQGEKIGVYGPNGCGKTTLIRCYIFNTKKLSLPMEQA